MIPENHIVRLTASNENGKALKVASITVLPKAVLPVFPGYTNPLTDPRQDSLYEDINGNKILDFDDLVTYYDNLDWIGEYGLDRRKCSSCFI